MKAAFRVISLMLGIFLVFIGAPEYSKFTSTGMLIGIPLMMAGLVIVGLCAK